MLNDAMNNLQIKLLEGPDSLINFALSKKFYENLSLALPGRRIWEELEYQWIITSQSVVQLPEHLPKNRALRILQYDIPKLAVVFEVFLAAAGAGHLLCEPVG
jgi:hypothetical protein